MNISNNNLGNVSSFRNNPTSKTNIPKETSIHASKNAVRIVIDPRTLSSKEYKDILKEKNRYPIINPNVLSYDDRLVLRRYSKN